MSVIAGKLSLPSVCVFAGLHQLAGGGLLTFNLILQFLHFVLVLGFVGDFRGFLEQPEEHLLEQLPHPSAGVPAQLVFDGVERKIGCSDLSQDLPLEVPEADLLVAVMV